MYGTKLVKREEVKPGQLVKFKSKTWTASAHRPNALYLKSLIDVTRTTEEMVEVVITKATDAL